MIVTTSHASIVNGHMHEVPANTVVETLIHLKQDFVFIRHSMEGNFASVAYIYKNGILSGENKILTFGGTTPIRYVSNFLSTLVYCLFSVKNLSVYVGVDPLNAIVGYVLKKLNVAKTFVYYVPDYSPARFKSNLLNKIYHTIDLYSVFSADYVWNVSSRICAVRKKQGLIDTKNILVPNVPSSDYLKFMDVKKDQYTLVTLGILSDQLDFVGIFNAIKELKDLFPIKFKVIGAGPKENDFKTLVKALGIQNNVQFLGFLNHDDALKEIASAGVGLALYNGTWGFNFYGDSMKCREFMCFGLPVLTTDTHSTVEEIKSHEVGIVCEMTAQAYVTALKQIFSNYAKFESNSYKLSRLYEGIHEKLLTEVINISK